MKAIEKKNISASLNVQRETTLGDNQSSLTEPQSKRRQTITRHHLFLLTFILSQTSPLLSYGGEIEDFSDQIKGVPLATPVNNQLSDYFIKEAEDLQKVILEISSKIPENASNNASEQSTKPNRVIVIGPSGSGKTTLIHGLAGINLIAIKDEEVGMRLEAAHQLDGFNVSHKVTVGTTIPHLWYDSVNNIEYWDCPGFGDPRGPAEDIVNAFTIQRLLHNSRVKILLAVPENHLLDKATPFLSLLKEIAALMPNQPLEEFLSIIITKHKEDINIEKRLQSILLGQKLLESGSKAKNLLDFIVKNRIQRIATFAYPTLEIDYNLNSDGILDCLGNTQFVDNPQVDLRVAGPESRNFVNGLAQGLNESIIKAIKDDCVPKIINHCQNKIDTHTGSMPALRNAFTTLKKDLENLCSQGSPMAFAEILSQFMNTDAMRRSIESIDFLQQILVNVTHNTTNWFQPLFELARQIETLTVTPQTKYSEGTLSLRGTLIGTSDIAEAITKTTNPIERLDAYSLNTLLFDHDLKSHGTSVALIAPHWKVVGKRTIDLSGIPSPIIFPVAAQGTDGVPGAPGGNAGHFYGRSDVFDTIDQLTVNTSGGQGGKGQDGGKGAPGISGTDGDKTVVSVEYIWGANGKRIDEERKTYTGKGTDGTPGQNGGRGGAGGFGGYEGTREIIGIDWSTIPQSRNDGEAGSPGAGGKGGTHGKNYQGNITRHVDKHGNTKSTVTDITPGYVDRGRASDGNPGNGLNPLEPQNPTPQIPLDKNAKERDYKDYFDSASNIFKIKKIFPSL